MAWTTNTASKRRCCALPSRTRSPSRTTSNGPSTHSAVATRSSTGPPTPPTLKHAAALEPAASPLRDLSLTLWSRKTSSHRPVWKRIGIVEAGTPEGAHGRRQPKKEVMTEPHSPQRKSYTAKTIFGVLLVAVVMVAAFATAGAAQNTGTPRSGELHVTKECSQYFGQAGQFCTITGSNLNAIDAGMKVIYILPAGATGVNSRPRPRRSGQQRRLRSRRPRVSRPLAVSVTFSGGTGRFSGFHASVVVTYNGHDSTVLGRNVQLHPTRPRPISRSATRSHRQNRLGTGPPVPSHVAQRRLECPRPSAVPPRQAKVNQVNRTTVTCPARRT